MKHRKPSRPPEKRKTRVRHNRRARRETVWLEMQSIGILLYGIGTLILALRWW